MMDGVRQYVFTVVAAALLCGILSSIFHQGKSKELLRILCGIFLTFTVLKPIIGADWTKFLEESIIFESDAQQAAALGENMARQATAELIKEKCQAYILDKAAELNVSITAEVTVSEEESPKPISVVISGQISPYSRAKLESILETDLGIAKENQVWTG